MKIYINRIIHVAVYHLSLPDKMSQAPLYHHLFIYIPTQNQYLHFIKDGKQMEERNERRKNGGSIKIILGSLSLLTIFATPYLNITQISFNLSLFQSAAYSFLLLGFWIAAGSLLREKHSEPILTTVHDHKLHHYRRHKPVVSV